MKILINKYIGNLGTKILIENCKDKLSNRFSDTYIENILSVLNENIEKNEIYKSLIEKCKNEKKIVDFEEVEYGGFLSSLWKISDRNKVGIRYSLKGIPLFQGVVEICNYYDIDLYRVLTKNVYIIFVEDEKEILDKEIFADFYLIGETNNKKQRLRVDGEVESFLTKSFKDELEKIVDVKKYKLKKNV